jgi:hypothetical protein
MGAAMPKSGPDARADACWWRFLAAFGGIIQLTWFLRKHPKLWLIRQQLTLPPSRYPSLRSDTRDLHDQAALLSLHFARSYVFLAQSPSICPNSFFSPLRFVQKEFVLRGLGFGYGCLKVFTLSLQVNWIVPTFSSAASRHCIPASAGGRRSSAAHG